VTLTLLYTCQCKCFNLCIWYACVDVSKL